MHEPDQWLGHLANITRLAIEVRHTGSIYPSGHNLDLLPAFLTAFRGLEWCFLVPPPYSDDPKILTRGFVDGDEEQEGEEDEDGNASGILTNGWNPPICED